VRLWSDAETVRIDARLCGQHRPRRALSLSASTSQPSVGSRLSGLPRWTTMRARRRMVPGQPQSSTADGAALRCTRGARVTVAILARDEERCIARCLDSVAGRGFDDIVVIGTASSTRPDGTWTRSSEHCWSVFRTPPKPEQYQTCAIPGPTSSSTASTCGRTADRDRPPASPSDPGVTRDRHRR
jgi:hypothetical protein